MLMSRKDMMPLNLLGSTNLDGHLPLRSLGACMENSQLYYHKRKFEVEAVELSDHQHMTNLLTKPTECCPQLPAPDTCL